MAHASSRRALFAAALLLSCSTDEQRPQTVAEDSCEAPGCKQTGAAPDGGLSPSSSDDGEGTPAETLIQPLNGGAACFSQGVDGPPLALYVMLDSSGSMEEPAGATNKWEAVKAALSTFLTETRESALQIGLQFFPLIKPGASFACTSHDDCGPDGGLCFLSTCLFNPCTVNEDCPGEGNNCIDGACSAASITLCRDDSDCLGTGNSCIDFGLCRDSDPNQPLACILGNACGNNLGPCEDFERTCTEATSCDVLAYQTPAVELGPVATTLPAIQAALESQPLQGLTPTAPAFQGAINHAREWAVAHPDHKVATLLVTDGLPSSCNPNAAGQASSPTEPIEEVLALATAASSATEPIQTFVMGVFAMSDQVSIDNVNAIARAGGTGNAFFVDATGSVEQQFLANLRGVRDAASPCTVELASADGLDFSRIDVQLVQANAAAEPVPNVATSAGCAATPRGWYYDVSPEQGTPRTLELCPDLCQLVRATPEAGLTVSIGCGS